MIRFPIFASIVALSLFLSIDARADQPLKRLLNYYDDHFDEQQHMLEVEFRSPGYHSKIPSGVLVHPTRESLYYAIALLKRNQKGDVPRAHQIIGKVLPFQETQQSSPAYGVWPWVTEEPLDQMGSVDLNWADFCGSAIAQLLVDHSDQLSSPLRQEMKTSLRHAAKAIQRRDVQPGYTNIAILGGGVCAIAGEQLNDKQLLDYGQRRLENIVRYTDTIDGFTEYNSPTYGKVVIGESERILQLAKSKRVRSAAESLRTSAWQMIGESFHPATQQWAGPHSRTSSLHLSHTMVEFLNARIEADDNFTIEPHPNSYRERPRGYAVVTPIPCPAKWLKQIKDPVAKNLQLRRTFILKRGSTPATVGTTWFSGPACLGSVSLSSFWTQRKPVVAYWKTDQDPAVAFRIRFLHDGSDFSSMGLRTSQDRNRVLCAFHSLQRRGDWHRTLDRPADGVFQAKDLRLRLELNGTGVSAHKLADGKFALRAGNHEMIVYPAESDFAGKAVDWVVKNEPGTAAIEAVCYSGESKDFNFSKPLDVKVAVGIELRSTHAASGPESAIAQPNLLTRQGKVIAHWNTGLNSKATAASLSIAVPNGQ